MPRPPLTLGTHGGPTPVGPSRWGGGAGELRGRGTITTCPESASQSSELCPRLSRANNRYTTQRKENGTIRTTTHVPKAKADHPSTTRRLHYHGVSEAARNKIWLKRIPLLSLLCHLLPRRTNMAFAPCTLAARDRPTWGESRRGILVRVSVEPDRFFPPMQGTRRG